MSSILVLPLVLKGVNYTRHGLTFHRRLNFASPREDNSNKLESSFSEVDSNERLCLLLDSSFTAFMILIGNLSSILKCLSWYYKRLLRYS